MPAPPAMSASETPRRHVARDTGTSARASACKWSWSQTGALAGLAVGGGDLLLGWGRATSGLWESAADLGDSLDRVCGAVVLAAFVGFIAGAVRDAVSRDGQRSGKARRSRARRRKTPPQEDRRVENIVARHWRGELPLWVSCWLFGVVGGIVVPFLPAVAVAAFKAGNDYNPSSIFSVSAAAWMAVFAFAVWQTVGVWRSAGRYAAARPASNERPDEMALAPVWSSLARLVVIAGCTCLLASFGTEWLPQLRELYKIAFFGDPEIPPYSITVTKDGVEAEIVGGFKFGLTDDFAALIEKARRLKVVHLDSAGGRLGEAERLFALIRARGLSTYVSSKCFSACTLAFAGGRERVLKRGATLGFHRAEFPGVSENEFDDLQHKVFSAAGFDSRFIAKALSTPHKDLWTPDPEVLLAAGVITGVTDGTRTARLAPVEAAMTPRPVMASK